VDNFFRRRRRRRYKTLTDSDTKQKINIDEAFLVYNNFGLFERGSCVKP
jgi:hypothetical protein